MTDKRIAVVGAGLAGSECAWVLASRYGLNVTLFEMKSIQPTPAQTSPHLFAELVCSNSLKSKSLLNPAGTLKHEITSLGSLVVPTAFAHEVPAGETLAVDRNLFSENITQILSSHERIRVEKKIITHIDELISDDNFAIDRFGGIGKYVP